MSEAASESAHATASPACPGCGSPIPASARYCPGCGRPVDLEAATIVHEELPPLGAGEPHWYGIAPALSLLALMLAGFAAAAFLFVAGEWPYGLIAAGAAVLFGTAFLEVARRKPDTVVARRSVETVDDVRARAGSILEALAIRSRASRETALLRLELRRLYLRRRDLLTAFGDAVYRGAEAEGLRRQLAELDDRARRLDEELHTLAVEARDRIEKTRLAVQETQMLQVPAAVVQEPYPPPDEGSPPAPAIVPEPAPPPDEGTPPAPDPEPDAPDRDD